MAETLRDAGRVQRHHGRAIPGHRNTLRIPYDAGSAEPEEPGMTLPDYIYSTYNLLLKDGWHMQEIDGMDVPGFLKVRVWDARRE